MMPPPEFGAAAAANGRGYPSGQPPRYDGIPPAAPSGYGYSGAQVPHDSRPRGSAPALQPGASGSAPSASLDDLLSMVDDGDEYGGSRREVAHNDHTGRDGTSDEMPRDLPPGWVAHKSKSRNAWFYYNERTKESVWTRPTA